MWGLFLDAMSRGCFITMCRLLIVVASLVAEHSFWGAQASVDVARRLNSWSFGLYNAGSVVVVYGLSCMGLGVCWQADSYPLCHQGSPGNI